MAAASTTALAVAPALASPHDGTIATVDSTTPRVAGAHHQRCAATQANAAATNATAAASHTTPVAGPMGVLSWASSAWPNALAKPITWMAACRIRKSAKAVRMAPYKAAQSVPRGSV